MPGSRLLRRLDDGPFFHGGNARGDGHHQLGPHQLASLENLGQKILDHDARHFKVGNDSVFEGPNGHHPLPVTPDDVSGFLTDGDHLVAVLVDGHHGGFIEHDPLSPQVDQGIGGAQVHGQIFGEVTEQTI